MHMKIHELNEARRNPQQNPKTAINKIIQDQLEATTDTVDGTANLFVTFTSVDKLGINPGSKYNTPLGIYSYPAEYVMDQVGSDLPMSHLPFAGRSAYVTVFKVSGNVVCLTYMTEDEVQPYLVKIAHILADAKGISVDRATSDVNMYYRDAHQEARVTTPGGRLWYVMWALTKYDLISAWRLSPPTAWTRLIRKMGVDGFIDGPVYGQGIIHHHEPTQAVFVNTSSIRIVGRYHNKHSPSSAQQSTNKGVAAKATGAELAATVRSFTNPQKALEWLDRTMEWGAVRYIRDRDIRDYVITNSDTSMIQLMRRLPHPTPRDQYASLMGSTGHSIEYIAHPDEGAIIKFLENTPADHTQLNSFFRGLVIHYSHAHGARASKQLQMLIVSHSPSQLKDIAVPHPDAIMHVLEVLGTAGELPSWLITKARQHGISLQNYRPSTDPHHIVDYRGNVADLRREIHTLGVELARLMGERAEIASSEFPEYLQRHLMGVVDEQIKRHQGTVARLERESRGLLKRNADYEDMWR